LFPKKGNTKAALLSRESVYRKEIVKNRGYTLWAAGLPCSLQTPLLRLVPQACSRVSLSDIRKATKRSLPNFDMESFRQAPDILKAGLIFPYLQGWGFVNRVRSECGWAAVDKLYADLPESTEQIIHPDRYIDRRDRPVRIALEKDINGWETVCEDSLGMWGMQQLA